VTINDSPAVGARQHRAMRLPSVWKSLQQRLNPARCPLLFPAISGACILEPSRRGDKRKQDVRMRKNQNTMEKRRREMDKKRKAEEKRELRRRRRQQVGEPTTTDIAVDKVYSAIAAVDL
jgi:hypothetical protein